MKRFRAVDVAVVIVNQNPDFDGVSVDACLVDPGSDSKGRRVRGPEFPHLFGTMLRKEVFVKEGLYEAEGGRWEPEALHARLRSKYRIGHIPIPFYRFQEERPSREGPAPLSSKGARER